MTRLHRLSLLRVRSGILASVDYREKRDLSAVRSRAGPLADERIFGADCAIDDD